ncbi:hypothetical protein RRG08_015124 [Elysia crispata]|uniref:C-type lectin domain-containing protein n=1 Tax=Elysia crispata TaxID=231223 RepID=A0AAE0YDF1_9GAST|nr:hypothetical protein RRG08_015124 [Elysia crispata]
MSNRFKSFKEKLARCPDGWSLTPSSDNCIKLFDEDKSWNDARRACVKKYHLSHLIRITDPRIGSFISNFISQHENGMNKFWVEKSLNHREVTEVYKRRHKILQTEYSPEHTSEDCLMMSNSTLYSTDCNYKLGYICETSAEDCSDLTECINRTLSGSLVGTMDLIHYFMKNGAGQLAQVCVQLAECWEGRDPLCTNDKHNQEIKGLMDTLCSQVGWDLIDKAQKQCLEGNSYSRMRKYVDDIQKKIPVQEDDSLCLRISDRLEDIAVTSDEHCGTHAAMLVILLYNLQFSLQYKEYNCSDLDATCWGLKSCLRSSGGDFASGREFQWEDIFRNLSHTDLRNLCSYEAHIKTCFDKYGHYCPNNKLVRDVKARTDVLQHACFDGFTEFESAGNDKSLRLFKAMSFLKEKCVEGFYDSLAPVDRKLIRDHAWNVYHSDVILCKRIEETEKDCVKSTSEKWFEPITGVNSYRSYKIWLGVWLKAMGENFIRARERCYNVSPCPPWTITKSDGSGCLVVYKNKTYNDAHAYCKKKGGHLVLVSDWKMFLTINDFLIKMSSSMYRKFSFWISRDSHMVKHVSNL